MRLKTVLTLVLTFLINLGTQAQFVTTWYADYSDKNITIPTKGIGYLYDVDWGDGIITKNATDDVSHRYNKVGTYTVTITGSFPRIYFEKRPSSLDRFRSVEQWGDQKWSSMAGAFSGCKMEINASDAPNLSDVTDASNMFYNGEISGDLTNWDVSSIVNASNMFSHAVLDVDFTGWNFENAVELSSMFHRAISLLPMEGWSLGSAEDMSYMFSWSEIEGISSIKNWNVSTVTDMSYMFQYCAFEAELDGWDVSKVMNMSSMFRNSNFSGQIGKWDVGMVIDMSEMFHNAEEFNSDIGEWDVGMAEDLSSMFENATSFNQVISNWNVSRVFNMNSLFEDAISFDQDLGDWDLSNVQTVFNILSNAGMSVENYDKSLHGWATQDLIPMQSSIGMDKLKYCASGSSRDLLAEKGWVFDDEGQDCSSAFITTWVVDEDLTVTLPTNSESGSYDFSVDWGDYMSTAENESASHIYRAPGKYNVKITGHFPHLFFGNDAISDDNEKIVDIVQWGNIEWLSFESAFENCANVNLSAQDLPNLGKVTNMSQAFYKASQFNGNIEDWDVSQIKSMVGTFKLATSFDGDLSRWNVGNLTQADSILSNSGLSVANYDKLLAGWSQLSLQPNVSFHAPEINYCNSEHYKQKILEDYSWTISDNGERCTNEGFITTWVIDDEKTITIPINEQETYNYHIDWGDDTTERHLTGVATHTYAKSGSYQVTITGNFPRIDFSESTNPFQIISIDQWGSHAWLSMAGAFQGCTNLIYNASDIPYLSRTKSLSRMFKDASSFNGKIGNWDVRSIEDMSGMFENALSFNQNLGAWDISSLERASQILDNSGLSNVNYDKLLYGWSDGPFKSNVKFGAVGIAYCNAFLERIILKNQGWEMIDGGQYCEGADFITKWEVPASNLHVELPISYYDYDPNFSIDWGDGNVTGIKRHTYEQPGTYTVKASGFFPHIDFSSTLSILPDNNNDKIVEVVQWGSQQWESFEKMFFGCRNLTITATDIPNMENVKDMSRAFERVRIESDISDWDVGSVQSFIGLFYGNNTFNQDIGKWDVSSGLDFSEMFRDADLFNQDLSNWDISSAKNMSKMFERALSFNQDLNNWDVRQVTDMSEMFRSAENFDSAIGLWDVSHVQDMSFMFYSTSFNQDISEWNVRSVKNVKRMFWHNRFFNQNISNWNVFYVENFEDMMIGCSMFNQDISGWELDNAINMKRILTSCTSFDQDLSDWDLPMIKNMSGALLGTNISLENYNSLLNSWAQKDLMRDVDFSSNLRFSHIGLDAWFKMIYEFDWRLGGNEYKNTSPTDILLTRTLEHETNEREETIGLLGVTDVDPYETYEFSLKEGIGDSDNVSFYIRNNELLLIREMDFETKSSYNLRIQVDDGNDGFFEKAFAVEILDVPDYPVGIILSDHEIRENENAGTIIGYLRTLNDEVGDVHSYSLVEGYDEASFSLGGSDGDELIANKSFDFEESETQTLVIRTENQHGSTFDEMFIINILDQSESPDDISLSNTNVDENAPKGTIVGSLQASDPDLNDTHTYFLASGEGSEHNEIFDIEGQKLIISSPINFEQNQTLNVRVGVMDQTFGSAEKKFQITINNIQEPPTDLLLSNAFVDENESSALVGVFSTEDDDANENHVYSLVSGSGSEDNHLFDVQGENLVTQVSLNFELESVFQIRVATTDGFEEIEKEFTISVNDVNEPPSQILLSNLSIGENLPSGTIVGSFSSIDDDRGDQHSYTLVSETGYSGNSFFEIEGNLLLTAIEFDFEILSSYNIKVQSLDNAENMLVESFSIQVNDIDDDRMDILAVKEDLSTIIYPNPSDSRVMVKNPFDEPVTIEVLNMNGVSVIYSGIERQKRSIDISNLKSGLYIVHLYTKHHKRVSAVLVKI